MSGRREAPQAAGRSGNDFFNGLPIARNIWSGYALALLLGLLSGLVPLAGSVVATVLAQAGGDPAAWWTPGRLAVAVFLSTGWLFATQTLFAVASFHFWLQCREGEAPVSQAELRAGLLAATAKARERDEKQRARRQRRRAPQDRADLEP